MKAIVLHIELTDQLTLKSISFTYNDTGIPSGTHLLGQLSKRILESIELDKNNDEINEMLSELKIKKLQ